MYVFRAVWDYVHSQNPEIVTKTAYNARNTAPTKKVEQFPCSYVLKGEKWPASANQDLSTASQDSRHVNRQFKIPVT